LKVSLNWIKDYIDLKSINAGDIINKLTMSGLEVEEALDESKVYKDFIVSYVKEKKKHPNADKLSLCTVNTGTQDLQVVCGAPNVEAGQKIVFAPIGALIPNGGFKIGKAKIRGVESFGMICSESELGLSEDHSGIMVLGEEAPIGQSIVSALGLNDAVLEVAITPNRSDALSHIGIARDIAALYEKELLIPQISIKESSHKIKDFASIEIHDKVNCPRYTAKVVRHITIKESPGWLKDKLKKIGLRPINNVVDVTNFVMYETGQPLHAFDLDQLKDNKLIVQSTDLESNFTTLDSKERTLPEGTLMICDAEKPVGIAGVMGGENSEISSSTKNILIESAHFNSSSIRRTSKLLGLSTEASYRFERTVDPNGTLYAAERAVQLIAELTGGEIASGTIDVYPEKIKEKEVSLRFERVKRVLGYTIENTKILSILKNLGLKVIYESDREIRFAAPTFRPDLEREIDLIEEVARINGYDNIPTISKISISLGEKLDESNFTDLLRQYSCALGLFEMINNPMQSEKIASLTGNKIPILNPQSMDMAFLRTSLIPGALVTVAKNINVGEKDLSLFEVGDIFNMNAGKKEIKSFEDFIESQNLLLLLTGKIDKKTWYSEEKQSDLHHLKGIVNSLLEKLSFSNELIESYESDDPESLFELTFSKTLGNLPFGRGGKIRKSVLKEYDIQQDVFCFETDIKLLKEAQKLLKQKKFLEPLKYPKSIRDLAFIFDKSVTYEQVIKFIRKSGSNLLKSIELFDLFENESLGVEKKSMAFSLEFYSEEKTLTEAEVEKEFNHIIASVTKNFNAALRGV
jgi:phenylalanyl-tRNA synthetase beta chain